MKTMLYGIINYIMIDIFRASPSGRSARKEEKCRNGIKTST
jgi:hypothetical protein